MSGSGLSGVRLGRLRDVLAGHVARGDVPGLVPWWPDAASARGSDRHDGGRWRRADAPRRDLPAPSTLIPWRS
jgi:hypothetical protein